MANWLKMYRKSGLAAGTSWCLHLEVLVLQEANSAFEIWKIFLWLRFEALLLKTLGVQFDRVAAMVNEHTSRVFLCWLGHWGSYSGTRAPELISVRMIWSVGFWSRGALSTFVVCWEEDAKHLSECVWVHFHVCVKRPSSVGPRSPDCRVSLPVFSSSFSYRPELCS